MDASVIGACTGGGINGKLLKPGEKGKIVLGNHSTFGAEAGYQSSHQRVSRRDSATFGHGQCGRKCKIRCCRHGDGKGGSGLETDVFPGERRLRSGGKYVLCGRVVLCVPTSAR
jgi:hypothetical protein